MLRRAAVLAATLTLTSALAAPAAAPAETVTLPGDAATGTATNAQIYQVACPAAGDCVAAGGYSDTSGNNQALIESESDGVWSAGSLADSSLPSAATSPAPQPNLSTVSCSGIGNCVAADAYDDSSGHEQGLIATESGDSWTPSELSLAGVQPTMPNPGAELYDVVCPAVLVCVGIGVYDAANTYTQGMIATQSAGVWSTAPLPQAPNWTDQSGPDLIDLECASAGNCAAVGAYTDSNGDQQGLLESATNGSWSATELDLTTNLTPAADPQALVSALSCPAAGSCVAVGTYADSAGERSRSQLSRSVASGRPPRA